MACYICSKFQYTLSRSCHQFRFLRKLSNCKKKSNIVPKDEVTRFILECLSKLKVEKNNAKIFAESLVIADYRGVASHGLNRLEHYIKDIRDKNCDPNAKPEIMQQSKSTAVVCGKNGFGSVIGMFCMKLAIKKAKETGIGMVVANGSNHFGLNSMYTNYAVSKGVIGMSFTNTSPVMVPTGAKEVCLGTNPLSIAAPAENCDSVVIDFATTAVALGKIEMLRRKKQKIPLGWALDSNGKPTDSPEAAMKAKKLMPLGGNENHKGTGLAIMVEILSGILADSAYGPHVRVWGKKPVKPANLGHGFIAIDQTKFAPGFEKRLSDLMEYIRKLAPADPKRPPLVPGDIERKIMEKIDEQGGIEYTDSHFKMLERIVKDLGVNPIKTKE